MCAVRGGGLGPGLRSRPQDHPPGNAQRGVLAGDVLLDAVRGVRAVHLRVRLDLPDHLPLAGTSYGIPSGWLHGVYHDRVTIG